MTSFAFNATPQDYRDYLCKAQEVDPRRKFRAEPESNGMNPLEQFIGLHAGELTVYQPGNDSAFVLQGGPFFQTPAWMQPLIDLYAVEAVRVVTVAQALEDFDRLINPDSPLGVIQGAVYEVVERAKDVYQQLTGLEMSQLSRSKKNYAILEILTRIRSTTRQVADAAVDVLKDHPDILQSLLAALQAQDDAFVALTRDPNF